MANVEKILKNMTLQEKIGQLTQYNAIMYVDSDATITGDMASLGLTKEDLKHVGHILNFSNSIEMRKIQDMHLEEDRNKIPMLFMMDVVHGFRTIYPIPLALGCSFNPDMVAECSKMAAKGSINSEKKGKDVDSLEISPHFISDMEFAEGYYDSVFGRLKCGWKRNGFKMEMEISLCPE